MAGTVYLVGAGPGDPGLLTLRGAELLSRAQVVVYDYLASPELLKLAPDDAEIIYAGKSGKNHTLSQDGINTLLIEKAKAGNSVVRLKGGDPYIFGRGGEEAQELYKAGISFEVVPGVSSTAAAAAYAGVPLTHRDYSSQVVFITGHEREEREGSVHDWKALKAIGTLVAVMGVKELPSIAANLLKAGKDPNTPCVMIERGTTPRQRVAAAPLEKIAETAESARISAPSLLVVGGVARLRDELNWFERRPLTGLRILLTRTSEQAGTLSRSLRELGAEVIERPIIKIEPAAQGGGALSDHIRRIKDYDYLVLTSPNGVKIFFAGLKEEKLDARALSGVRIAVMGPGTGEALASYGLIPDILPERFVSEGLLEAFKKEKPGKALLARAAEAREVLPRGLTDMGFSVEILTLYRTSPVPKTEADEDLLIDPPHLSTITSASTARGLSGLVPEGLRVKFPCASIGPVTTAEARRLGFPVALEAEVSTVSGLVEAILKGAERIRSRRI
ncbi:MAG: uroporphyrinogen-III C-methyltransferase [Deltaproteobacteria bacterium]|jgi:uroporphyrinogen III methyltransferase/synthase|nr:uroporphyrinogen-III C-methyltransferase [Deltaproteobacteria bacterium]